MTVNHPTQMASAEGTISPGTARQAATIFLAEGATPEWMRDAARESELPGMLAAVAGAMEALLAEGPGSA